MAFTDTHIKGINGIYVSWRRKSDPNQASLNFSQSLCLSFFAFFFLFGAKFNRISSFCSIEHPNTRTSCSHFESVSTSTSHTIVFLEVCIARALFYFLLSLHSRISIHIFFFFGTDLVSFRSNACCIPIPLNQNSRYVKYKRHNL